MGAARDRTLPSRPGVDARWSRREEVTLHSSQTLLAALATCLAYISLAPVSAQQVGTPSGSGPYPAIAESRAELPRHTVYRPAAGPIHRALIRNGTTMDADPNRESI
jgi:hypothetical protein